MLLPCDPSSTFLDSTFDRLASMYPREDQKGSVLARWPISISRKDADVFAKLAPFQEEKEREREREGMKVGDPWRGSGHFVIRRDAETAGAVD